MKHPPSQPLVRPGETPHQTPPINRKHLAEPTSITTRNRRQQNDPHTHDRRHDESTVQHHLPRSRPAPPHPQRTRPSQPHRGTHRLQRRLRPPHTPQHPSLRRRHSQRNQHNQHPRRRLQPEHHLHPRRHPLRPTATLDQLPQRHNQDTAGPGPPPHRMRHTHQRETSPKAQASAHPPQSR